MYAEVWQIIFIDLPNISITFASYDQIVSTDIELGRHEKINKWFQFLYSKTLWRGFTMIIF